VANTTKITYYNTTVEEETENTLELLDFLNMGALKASEEMKSLTKQFGAAHGISSFVNLAYLGAVLSTPYG